MKKGKKNNILTLNFKMLTRFDHDLMDRVLDDGGSALGALYV